MISLLRRLPHFKGKNKLAKLSMPKGVEKEQEQLISGKRGLQYYVPNIIESIGFELYVNGIYEAKFIDLICKNLPQGGSFLDLGANIGAISVPVSRNRTDIQVYSVEPEPSIFNYLERNKALNSSKNIELINKAIFDKDDVSLNFYSADTQFGKGSISPVFSQKGQTVASISVDTIASKYGIDKDLVIKADLEGHEYFAFMGAQKLLNSQTPPKIFFEFVDWAEDHAEGLKAGMAQELLFDLGYTLYEVDQNNFLKANSVKTKGACNFWAIKQ